MSPAALRLVHSDRKQASTPSLRQAARARRERIKLIRTFNLMSAVQGTSSSGTHLMLGLTCCHPSEPKLDIHSHVHRQDQSQLSSHQHVQHLEAQVSALFAD